LGLRKHARWQVLGVGCLSRSTITWATLARFIVTVKGHNVE
jgi:hypothetical protein